MSRINAHKVQTEQRYGDRDETLVPAIHEGNEVFSATDGEELSAASEIIDLLDGLDNGEALVITREIW